MILQILIQTTPPQPEPTATPVPGLSFGGATVANRSYAVNTAITTLTLPSASGASGTVTYSLSPALPAGLSFDATTRKITGQATASFAATIYTYTASHDTWYGSPTLQFSLEVEHKGSLSWTTIGSDTFNTDKEYDQGDSVTKFELPYAHHQGIGSGGGNITYTLTPVLPGGITYTASQGNLRHEIDGTANASSPKTTYTFKAEKGGFVGHHQLHHQGGRQARRADGDAAHHQPGDLPKGGLD